MDTPTTRTLGVNMSKPKNTKPTFKRLNLHIPDSLWRRFCRHPLRREAASDSEAVRMALRVVCELPNVGAIEGNA